MILILYRPYYLFNHLYAYPVYLLQLLRFLRMAQCEYELVVQVKTSDEQIFKIDFSKYKLVFYISNLITDYDLSCLKSMKETYSSLKLICCTQDEGKNSDIRESCDEIISRDYRKKCLAVIQKLSSAEHQDLSARFSYLTDKNKFPWLLRDINSYQVNYLPFLFTKKVRPCFYYHINNNFDYTWFNYNRKFFNNKTDGSRDPEELLQEIEWEYKKKIRMESIFFVDRCFNFDSEWLIKFCQEKLSRGLTLPWMANFTMEKLDAPQLKLLKKSNLIALTGNISSGCQDSLEKVTFNYDRLAENISLCRELNLKIILFWEIGYPNDRRKDIRTCYREVIEKNLVHIAGMFFLLAMPLINTLFYRHLREKEEIDEGFDLRQDNGALLCNKKVTFFGKKEACFNTNYLAKDELSNLFKEITDTVAKRDFKQRYCFALAPSKKVEISFFKDLPEKLFSKKISSYAYYHVNREVKGDWFSYNKKFSNNRLEKHRSLEEIWEEIEGEFALKKREPELVFFIDRCFNFDAEWLLEFCREKINRGLTFPWMANFTMENLNAAQLKLLKESNLVTVISNISAGFQDDLKKRIVDYDCLSNIVELCRKHDLQVILFWELGYPNDSREGLFRCYHEFIEKNIYNIDVLILSFAAPFKNTVFYRYLADNQEIESNFEPASGNGALVYGKWVNIYENTRACFGTKYLKKEELQAIFENINLSLKTKFLRENLGSRFLTYFIKGIFKPQKSITLIKKLFL